MSFVLKQQLQRHLVIGWRSPVVDGDLRGPGGSRLVTSAAPFPGKKQTTVADLCSLVVSVNELSQKQPGLRPSGQRVSGKQ